MNSKIVFGLFLLSLFCCVSGQSNNLDIGNKEPGDRLLHYEIVKKSSSLLGIVTEDLDFPVPGTVNYAKINYISARDEYTDGNGARCTISAGGIGFTNVSLHFKSQRSHGIKFYVEIWGQ